MRYYDCTDKAVDLWRDICVAWFDYDTRSYVTEKAYQIHVEIHMILTGGICVHW